MRKLLIVAVVALMAGCGGGSSTNPQESSSQNTDNISGTYKSVGEDCIIIDPVGTFTLTKTSKTVNNDGVTYDVYNGVNNTTKISGTLIYNTNHQLFASCLDDGVWDGIIKHCAYGCIGSVGNDGDIGVVCDDGDSGETCGVKLLKQ